jgi:hypothetical protein
MNAEEERKSWHDGFVEIAAADDQFFHLLQGHQVSQRSTHPSGGDLALMI